MKRKYQKPLYEQREVRKHWEAHEKRVRELLTSHTSRPKQATPKQGKFRVLVLALKEHQHLNKNLFERIMYQSTRRQGPKPLAPVPREHYSQRFQARRVVEQNQALLLKIADARSVYSLKQFSKWKASC
jgi:hypothetical protein